MLMQSFPHIVRFCNYNVLIVIAGVRQRFGSRLPLRLRGG